MITIEQLLESVDLEFKPRWVAKNANGHILYFNAKPELWSEGWWHKTCNVANIPRIKVAEFENKPWQECIYEVPRKTTNSKMESVGKTTGKIEKLETTEKQRFVMLNKINELVDAVNELKAKFALPTLNPDLTDEDLRKMMCMPAYWRDQDPVITQKIKDGFNKLYGDNVLKAKGE